MTMFMQVIATYNTDHFPLMGNIAEEVLELATGGGVYLNPGEEDEVYPDVDEAFERCVGQPTVNPALLAAWATGYALKRQNA